MKNALDYDNKKDTEVRKIEERLLVTYKETNHTYIVEDGIITGPVNEKIPPDLDLSKIQTEINPTNWTSENVTVEISSKEEGYSLQYSYNSVDWVAYQQKIKVENNQIIYVRLANSIGLPGGHTTINVTNIDRLVPNNFTPTATSTTDTITLMGNTTDQIETSSDGNSGIKEYQFSKDNGVTWQTNNNKLQTNYSYIDLAQNAVFNLKMKAIDNAGNQMITKSITIKTKSDVTIPDGATIIEGDKNKGIVMKDKNGNEWVWIEVPKSITKSKTTDTEIETALQNYATDYRQSGWTDTWYEGCGLTEQEYNVNKSKMLQSIKANGGFWIGRYEVGTDTIRKAVADTLTTPLIKQDQYPYNFVTCSQAQGLSNQLNPNNMKYTSSLMYGVQWDLVLKYIESKGAKTQTELKIDSTTWGNYRNATFDLVRGKYSINDGQTYTDITTFTKPMDTNVLLSTGASERNKVLNIYNLAGNECEWTLERDTDEYKSCSRRAGSFGSSGSYPSSVGRSHDAPSASYYYVSFRTTLY